MLNEEKQQAQPSVEAYITDEALNALRAKLGQVISSSHTPYLTETSRDAVRHWAEGIGDMNPLWTEESRGRNSAWGKSLCPPTMLYAFDRLAIGYRGGLPGVHSMFGGSDWTWHRPIGWGERIHTVVRFVDLIERPSAFAGRSFQQISEISFVTDTGETVALARSWGFRVERTTAAKKGKYREIEIATYTPAEVQAITERYREEKIRGSTPLYIEKVKQGDAIPEIIRGPYTVTTAVAFEQGWGGLFIKAHGHAMEYFTRHPRAGIINGFGIPEPPEAVHWDNDLARRVGVPAAYDYGPERISWIGSLLTNWIGDNGFLERLHVQIRRHNIIGDLTTCRAIITSVDQQTGVVELTVQAENQRNECTALGEARVRLPSRQRNETKPHLPEKKVP
jgi:acyl dehydratase